MAIKDRDKEGKVRTAGRLSLTLQTLVSLQALVSIAYETAHWLSRTTRGFMPYDHAVNPSRPEFSLEANDVGTIAISQLFGSQCVACPPPS